MLHASGCQNGFGVNISRRRRPPSLCTTCQPAAHIDGTEHAPGSTGRDCSHNEFPRPPSNSLPCHASMSAQSARPWRRIDVGHLIPKAPVQAAMWAHPGVGMAIGAPTTPPRPATMFKESPQGGLPQLLSAYTPPPRHHLCVRPHMLADIPATPGRRLRTDTPTIMPKSPP